MSVPRPRTQIQPVMHLHPPLSTPRLPLAGRAEEGILEKGNSYTLELPRSKLRGIKPLNPETVVVRTALARQFGGVEHGVSGGGTLCAPSHHSNGPSWRCRG